MNMWLTNMSGEHKQQCTPGCFYLKRCHKTKGGLFIVPSTQQSCWGDTERGRGAGLVCTVYFVYCGFGLVCWIWPAVVSQAGQMLGRGVWLNIICPFIISLSHLLLCFSCFYFKSSGSSATAVVMLLGYYVFTNKCYVNTA